MSYPTFPSALTTEISSIIMHEGKVLIGRPSEGKWDVPTAILGEFEGIKDAAMRAVFENTGISTDPQNVMFVSESIKKEANEHRVIIYLFSKYVEGENTAGGAWTESLWVDVRELAQYQDEMSDACVDAFYKFSLVLRQSSAKSGAQA